MAYSDANTDVRPYVRAFLMNGTADFTTDTQPTLDDVTNIISQVDGEINGALNAAGISTISSTSLSDLCKKYSAMASAGLVMQTYGENQENFQKGDWFYSKFEAWINNIITDSAYQEYLYTLESGLVNQIYIDNQVTDGTFTSTQVNYINEGFEG